MNRHALDSVSWDPCEYLTAAQERILATKFRLHVMNLPPGSPFGWRDMDAWAKANHPVPRRPVPKDQDYWEDLCVMCMVISGDHLEPEGWLRYQHFLALRHDSDEYFRTDKTELEVWD
jgi:hypothetical protein